MPLEQTHDFSCPYCGSANMLEIDFTGGRRQDFVVDCENCCAPIAVRVTIADAKRLWVEVRRENE